jgi:hypothetical protein
MWYPIEIEWVPACLCRAKLSEPLPGLLDGPAVYPKEWLACSSQRRAPVCPVCLTRLPHPSARPSARPSASPVCLARLPARLPVERGRKTKEGATQKLKKFDLKKINSVKKEIWFKENEIWFKENEIWFKENEIWFKENKFCKKRNLI